MWSTLLFSTFKDLGFVQSTLDKCLWYKKDIFVTIYVDDCGISAKSNTLIVELIEQLQENKGFKLTKEGTFSEFLGIQYSSDDKGNVHLSQEGLIKKILTVTGLEGANPNKLPTKREPLGIDPDGEPFDEEWNYPSVVGMLLYLSTNNRPDITFAVNQVARFTRSPKKSHCIAVKMIIRYLKRTLNQGTIVSKFHSLDVEGYSDADFCGLFKYDPDQSVTSAKSRAGYIIKVAGCPLVWKSQLMQSICLSTAESEYYSLSLLMRAMIPIRALLFEMISKLNIPCNLAEVKFTINVDKKLQQLLLWWIRKLQAVLVTTMPKCTTSGLKSTMVLMTSFIVKLQKCLPTTLLKGFHMIHSFIFVIRFKVGDNYCCIAPPSQDSIHWRES
jgi:Reverse transcriptase (RNA-dependent DNA polymerase).